MTQKAALCHALLQGETLSIMDGFKRFGITNLPRSIGRSVERDFNVIVSRNPKRSKTRYGTPCNYYEYYLNKAASVNKDGIKTMKEYVKEQSKKTK